MAEVVDVIFIDERTGKEIPMTAKDKEKNKKKLKGWILAGGAFVIGIFYGFFTGGGGFRINRIDIKYIDPNSQREL